jgi:chaperonin GroES
VLITDGEARTVNTDRPRPNEARQKTEFVMSKKDSKGGSKVKIRPLQDRVLIKRIDEQEQVRGGIIIPDTAKEKPQEAEVIAVGPGKLDDDGKRLPVDVKVGDKVLVGKYSGSDIKIDGDDYVILREDEILAVVG